MKKRKAGINMTRGRTTQQIKRLPFQWVLFVLFAIGAIGLNGCAPTTTTAVPTILTPCSPSAAGIPNGFATLGPPTLNILQYAATSTPDPTSNLQPQDITILQDQKILQARHAAMNLLTHEVKRWTQINEVEIDGINNVHVAVTFLSPELLEAIFQNHIFAHTPKSIDVQATLYNDLAQIYNREELIFLITVFTSNPTPPAHKLDLNIPQMYLKNANNYAVTPKHDDHNLDQVIQLKNGPEFGYIYYPFSVTSNGLCEQVLDRENNTKINIETPDILVDSISKGSYIWTIPYAPLVETGNSFYTPQYPDQAMTISIDALSPLPTLITTNPTHENFWRDFGRYVWGQVTLENY